MTEKVKRYAIRDRFGVHEIVFIEHQKNGFWRGYRAADAVSTRGKIVHLISRHDDLAAAKAALGGAE